MKKPSIPKVRKILDVIKWQAFKARKTEFSVDDVKGEPVCPAPCHFVPTSEEVADALLDVSVNTAKC
jgi:hypothetical protein